MVVYWLVPDNSRASRWGLAVFSFLILALRRPGALSHPQFWAEDSVVFYRDQLVLGSFHALFKPHAGYLCLIARMIAMASAGLPAAFVPLAFNTAALALAALSCAFLFLPWYRHLIESWPLRAMVCILFAAGFVMGEVVGNVTNMQWYLALPGILLLARRPEDDATTSLPKLVGLALAGFVAGLSSPVLIILLPICAGMLVRRGLRRSGIVPGGILLALSIQMVVMLSSSGVGGSLWPIEHTLPGDLTASILFRSILPSVAGQIGSQYLANNFPDASVVFFLIAAVLWMVWLWQAEKSHRIRLAIAWYLAIASVAVATVVRGRPTGFANLSGVRVWGAERFFYLASCVFAYLAARSLARIASSRVAAILFGMLFGFGVAKDFQVSRLFDYWSQDAHAVDIWRQGLRDGRAEGVELPVNPPGWELQLPGTAPVNAGFERVTLSPWAVFGRATGVVSGVVYCEGKQAELANSGGVFQDLAGLKPGALYKISAHARCVCGSPTFASLWLHDTFGRNAAADGPYRVSCDRWDEFSAEFKAGTLGMLRIHLAGLTDGGRIFWDDVRVVRER